MKFFSLLATAALAVAAPSESLDGNRLDVHIDKFGNSKMRAVVRNVGNSDLNLLKTGSLLDEANVEKVQVFSRGGLVPFLGIRVSMEVANAPKHAFVRVPAGGSVEREFDIAEFHDLSKGGGFNIRANGAFHYARGDSHSVEGIIPYKSNHVTGAIDGEQASQVYTSYHRKRAEKRAKINGCSGDQLTAAQTALSNCEKRSQKAYAAAMNGTATKMEEYFKSSSQQTRSTVAGVFQKIATQCGSSGTAGYSCADIDNYCGQSGATAYAEVNVGSTVYCSDYWAAPAVATQCHEGDQAGITIHEMSHLKEVKGTDDFGGYGYETVKTLTGEQNVNHADTYQMFANAIELGC